MAVLRLITSSRQRGACAIRNRVRPGILANALTANLLDDAGKALVIRKTPGRLFGVLERVGDISGLSAEFDECRELRDWMGAQYVDRLQLRMDRRLNIIVHAHRLVRREEHSHLALFRLARGRSDWDCYQA